MASYVHNVSSGSEADTKYEMIDERKRRRMISNRESARRSRMRKRQHVEDLINEVSKLQKANSEIALQINQTSQLYAGIENENNILRAQVMELNDRLESLNSVLGIVEEVKGYSFDIPQMADPLLKPWQLPYPSQPLMASASMFLS
ncbi:Basic-leucine zipper domain [Dillenia turbinata]|uniref:Basic-leucine zipper domain n=1 Tax=Dillenia turbinata TaxID=194707 RepID=A0AAN8YUL3_9MAGN